MGRIKCRATYFRAPFISPRFIRQPGEAWGAITRRGEAQGAAPETALRSRSGVRVSVPRSPRVPQDARRPGAQEEVQISPRPTRRKKTNPYRAPQPGSHGVSRPLRVRSGSPLSPWAPGTAGEPQGHLRPPRWGGPRGDAMPPGAGEGEQASWGPQGRYSPGPQAPSHRLETDRASAVLLLGRARASCLSRCWARTPILGSRGWENSVPLSRGPCLGPVGRGSGPGGVGSPACTVGSGRGLRRACVYKSDKKRFIL